MQLSGRYKIKSLHIFFENKWFIQYVGEKYADPVDVVRIGYVDPHPILGSCNLLLTGPTNRPLTVQPGTKDKLFGARVVQTSDHGWLGAVLILVGFLPSVHRWDNKASKHTRSRYIPEYRSI